MDRFRAAPWPTGLKVVSVVGTLALGVAHFALRHAVPRGTAAPFAEPFGIVLSLVPPAIAAVAALFAVRSYELGRGELRIQRLLWSTRVPTDGVVRAWHDPKAMCGSLRVFGNGGLYAITGSYRNRTLGRYRAYVTDPGRAVVLELPGRTIVVSPEEPAVFVEAVLRNPSHAP